MKNNNNIESDVDVYDVAAQKSALFGINDDDEISIRKFMMLRLLKIVPELENKILNGRINDKESEKIRLEYFKQYVNVCNCINNFTKDATYKIQKDMLKDFLDVDIVENQE